MEDAASSNDAADDAPLLASPIASLHLDPGRVVTEGWDEVYLLFTLNASDTSSLGYVDSRSGSLDLGLPGLKGSISVSQDTTALQNTRGNTGSIVWRSSLHLASVLAQKHKPLVSLTELNVIELGAGTGALAALVGHLARRWMATDQVELLPLLRRNGVHAEPLDWNDFTTQVPSAKERVVRQALHQLDGDFPDLIVASDCVYNPALYECLTATLTALTKPSHTVVLLVAQMRTEEGMAEFLDAWIQSHPSWYIVSLEERVPPGFALFAGWRLTERQTGI